MNLGPKDDGDTAAVDQSLANLIERVAGQLERQEAVDFETLIRQYPQHTERLRELLPAMQAMSQLADVGSAAEAHLRGQGQVPSDGHSGGNGRVLGDFRILRELGHGGMGSVYEAEQISLQRRVC